jgi:hypothetical protein
VKLKCKNEKCEYSDKTFENGCKNLLLDDIQRCEDYMPDNCSNPDKPPIDAGADPVNHPAETAPKNNLQEGKPRPSLIPLDVLIKHLCPAYEEGIPKYYRESWRKGFQTSVMIDAALRHITEFFWHGKDIDEESGKHHLAGAIFSLISILHTLDTRPELDDRISSGK